MTLEANSCVEANLLCTNYSESGSNCLKFRDPGHIENIIINVFSHAKNYLTSNAFNTKNEHRKVQMLKTEKKYKPSFNSDTKHL